MSDAIRVPMVAARAPEYAHHDDAGADLCAAEELTIGPGERALIATGVSIALPEGYAAFVVPRSGLAVRQGLTVLNSPGTIDAGYRGEIRVPLLNTDRHDAIDIAVGDRIAQLVIMPVIRADFIRVQQLPDSVRGTGGFGSTGVAGEAGALSRDLDDNKGDSAR